MVTVTGELGLAITGLEDLIAASSTFQTRAGMTAAQLEAERIFYDEAHLPSEDEDALAALRPFVMIFDEEYGHAIEGQGAVISMAIEGSFSIFISDNALHGDQVESLALHKESRLDFINFYSGLITDLVLANGADGNFAFVESSMTEPVARVARKHRNKNNDYWQASHLLRWGHT